LIFIKKYVIILKKDIAEARSWFTAAHLTFIKIYYIIIMERYIYKYVAAARPMIL
jgi:hypothetical protein